MKEGNPSRQWIDEDTPGHSYLMNVPVGGALTVPLIVMSICFGAANDEELQWHASEFATAPINLKLADRMLEKYARDVRAGRSRPWSCGSCIE